MKEHKFFICKHCGNIVGLVKDGGVPMICCGEPMTQLKANTTDGATEKHLPAVKIEGNTIHVQVGDVPHPMLEEHYIQFIYLQTEKGGQRKALSPGETPNASFSLIDDKPLAVFEYCNLHGLWKTEL